jgi:hypothetical protein
LNLPILIFFVIKRINKPINPITELETMLEIAIPSIPKFGINIKSDNKLNSIFPTKKEYIYFVIESGEKMYLLYGAYGAKEYLDFAKETMPDGTFFEKDFYETDSVREFVQLYRKRFFKKVEISDEETRAMIDRVCVLDWSKVTNDCQGFDGFSLLAYYPKKDETIRFWCNYHNDANTPLATLANAFLSDMGVDSAYRFGQCAKKFPRKL